MKNCDVLYVNLVAIDWFFLIKNYDPNSNTINIGVIILIGYFWWKARILED